MRTGLSALRPWVDRLIGFNAATLLLNCIQERWLYALGNLLIIGVMLLSLPTATEVDKEPV
jgi:hypothetical protein